MYMITPTEAAGQENEALAPPPTQQPVTEPEDKNTTEGDQPVAATPTQQAAAEPESSQPTKKAKHD